jgi:TonB family protein
MPLDGAVTLSGVVDANGLPRDMKNLGSFEANLVKLALDLVAEEKFKPGTHDGISASVAVTIEIGLQTCAKRVKGDAAEPYQVTLRSHPVQALSVRSEPAVAPATPDSNGTAGSHKWDGITRPVPLLEPEAKYPKAARKQGLTGVCLVGLIVDANGMPQNVHILKSLEPSLDQSAVESVRKYRFKPATKDGVPVAVEVNIEVNFRLY